MEVLREQISGELHLLLTWLGREFYIDENGLVIGRSQQADMRLRPGCVSRVHAELRRNPRNGQFELIDRSTNGTYLQTEDGQVTHVHRRTVALWGEGYLSFGEPLREDRAVRFAHV